MAALVAALIIQAVLIPQPTYGWCGDPARFTPDVTCRADGHPRLCADPQQPCLHPRPLK
jgi:hypothetical protein